MGEEVTDKTVQPRDEVLAEKDRQIAALVEALAHAQVCGPCSESSWSDCFDGKQSLALLSDLSSAAEAHDARVRAEARRAAIEECAAVCDERVAAMLDAESRTGSSDYKGRGSMAFWLANHIRALAAREEKT